MKPTTKVCKKCKVEKSLEAFHKSKTSYLGVNPTCKDCRNRPPKPFCANPRAAEEKYAAKNKHKKKAKELVRQAIKDGRLIKLPCEHCSSTINIEGHHPDYNEPLIVIWLCIKCHNLEHKRLRELTTLIN